MGVYGYPRYTGDIDFWIEASLENGGRMVSVFNDFGLNSFGLKAEDFAKSEQVIQVGYPPYRIDILTTIDGVDFGSAYPNRQIVEIDGILISFIGLEDLKANKRASGRNKDLDDLANIEK